MDTVNISPRGFKKAANELTEEHLNTPIDDVAKAPELAVESSPKPEVEPTVESTPTEITEEVEVEEAKVPKSRFLTMHTRAIEAERRIREIEAERSQQVETPESEPEIAELPDYWVEMFGDSDASLKAFQAEQKRLSTIEDRAAERAFQRWEGREKEEAARAEEIVQSFDQAFEELGIVTDKEFTDDEQVAILDIVEEYSPKDADGKMLREYLLPLDKAYEIYSVRNEAKTSAKREARSQVASLTGARSEGSPSNGTGQAWQPGQWRNKVP